MTTVLLMWAQKTGMRVSSLHSHYFTENTLASWLTGGKDIALACEDPLDFNVITFTGLIDDRQ